MQKNKSSKKYLQSLGEFVTMTTIILTSISALVAFFNYHHENEVLTLGRYEKVCRFLNDPAAYDECFLYEYVAGGEAKTIYTKARNTAVGLPVLYLSGVALISFVSKKKH